LINKQAPEFNLPVLANPGRLMSGDSFLGKPYLVNFWASWCITCRVEHPVITALAKRGILPIIGLNTRDATEDAVAWLERHGDPYDVILADRDGRISIDFGVYAAPETFLIDASGVIVFKHIGPLTAEIVETQILPLIATLGSGS
jgi:cytochrome c biogenesis protein CcmG/thiol:disulfide interchange protein DsbE